VHHTGRDEPFGCSGSSDGRSEFSDLFDRPSQKAVNTLRLVRTRDPARSGHRCSAQNG